MRPDIEKAKSRALLHIVGACGITSTAMFIAAVRFPFWPYVMYLTGVAALSIVVKELAEQFVGQTWAEFWIDILELETGVLLAGVIALTWWA